MRRFLTSLYIRKLLFNPIDEFSLNVFFLFLVFFFEVQIWIRSFRFIYRMRCFTISINPRDPIERWDKRQKLNDENGLPFSKMSCCLFSFRLFFYSKQNKFEESWIWIIFYWLRKVVPFTLEATSRFSL